MTEKTRRGHRARPHPLRIISEVAFVATCGPRKQSPDTSGELRLAATRGKSIQVEGRAGAGPRGTKRPLRQEHSSEGERGPLTGPEVQRGARSQGALGAVISEMTWTARGRF